MTSATRPAAGSGSARRSAKSGHPWGVLSIGYADRAGSIRYVLTVFPPGTTIDQRRALMFRRQWFPWGAMAWFIVASGLSIVINGWAAIAIGGAIYVGALLMANAQAGTARHGVVEVHAQLVSLMGHRQAFGGYELLERTASQLLELDALTDQGRMDAVEYELKWGEIYQEIEAETPGNHGSRR